uniref:protein-tyrosine-phosphatase n=1 Tax=Pelusios castaneus TaxID=367368 RepID=A0A8C8VLS2_9SAUR
MRPSFQESPVCSIRLAVQLIRVSCEPWAEPGWDQGSSLLSAVVDSAGSLLNVSVSDQGRPDSLLLSWDEPDGGALGYSLAIYTLEPDALLQNGSAGPNATSFRFQGLTPGMGYGIEVTAALACAETSSQRVSPAPVHNVSLSNNGNPFTLRASWMDAPGEKDGYRLVLYHLDSQRAMRNASVSRASSTFLFDGLLAGSEYALQISTLAGARQASTRIHQWTRPTAPAELTLQSLGSSTSLFASWISAEGAAWLHLTLHNLLSHLVTRTVSAKRGLSNYTFQHLSPGTPYHLGVSGVAGPYWAAGPNTTSWTYPSAPSGVTLTSQTHPLGLSAVWYSASGDRDQFLLHLNSKEHLVQHNVSVGPDTQNFTFLGLLPGSQYSLEVVALAGPYRASAPSVTAWTCECRHAVCGGRWMESGGGRDHWLQLYADDSLSIIRNVSVQRGATHINLDGLVPGARYQVKIISQDLSQVCDLNQTACHGLVWVMEPTSEPLFPLGTSATSTPQILRAPLRCNRASGRKKVLVDGQEVLWGRNDSTNVSLVGLAPGSCYHIGISALAGPYSSDPQNVTGCTDPLAPPNISLTNQGHPDRLSASWGAATGGRDGYSLTLYHMGSGTVAARASVEKDTHNFTFANLAPGTGFSCQALWGSPSSCQQSTYPLAPRNVSLTNQGFSDRLNASWGAAAGERDSYTLTLYHARSGAGAAKVSVGKDAHTFTFSDLAAGHKYFLEVVSTAGPYRTSAGNISDWTTPLVPANLSAVAGESSTVLSVSWGRAASQQDYCQLWLRDPENNTLPRRHTLAEGQIQHFFRRLVPGRNYSLSLSCVAGPYWNSTGILEVVSPFSAPDPVEDLRCQPDTRSFSLNWTFPPGDVEACELVAERLSGGPRQAEASLIAPSSKASLEGLKPGSSYRVSVSTMGRNGLRSRAVTLVCNTSEEGRSPPGLWSPHDPPEELPGWVSAPLRPGCTDPCRGVGAADEMFVSLTPVLRPTQEIMSKTWYDHYYGQEDSYVAVLLPNPFHPDKRGAPKSWSVPVGTEECGWSREICNGKLKANTQYRFSVAAFTKYDLVNPAVSFTTFSGKGENVHRPIPIQSFKQHYEAKTANANQGFFQEFEELKEIGKEQPKVEAELPANVSKNRYPHVLPYDHSRVRLSQLGEEPHSDYINANFIPGYTSPQEFIATQGPLKKTIEDFWRLVWEQSICTIVMLTVGMENGRVLCDHYWPSESSPGSYGPFHIHLISESSSDEWTTRTFKLWHVSEQPGGRHVTHLQYTAWPDHGIPESTASLISFMELVQEHVQAAKGSGPTLVHCSAGVGRSGTFISLYRLLQQLKEEKVVDVFNTVYTMRMSRYQMIQTLVRPCLPPVPLCHKISRAAREPRAQLSHLFAWQPAPNIPDSPRPPGHRTALPCSGIGQMGTLIALDCLLQQMKAERSVDVYGVTLRLMRSCCLMTPTPVGSTEGAEARSDPGKQRPAVH